MPTEEVSTRITENVHYNDEAVMISCISLIALLVCGCNTCCIEALEHVLLCPSLFTACKLFSITIELALL